MKPKILILTGTHGDEGFSIPIVNKLLKTFKFDWVVSNPKALRYKKRFLDADLNRSGPGSYSSKKYEIRRAKEIITLASQYDQVIDIHGTTSKTGIFTILSDPNWNNIELAKKLSIKNVVLWPSFQEKGPLTQFIPNSLEIECDPKNAQKTATELEPILSRFLSGEMSKQTQSYYIVTGLIRSKINKPLINFKPTKYKNQTIIPLLVNQYPGISCYTLAKIDKTLDYGSK